MNIKLLPFIIYVSIVICATACSSGSKNATQQIKKVSATSGQDSLLIGNWFIGTQYYNNTAVMCNVCPHIEFKRGGFAKIIKANNSFEYLQWHIKDKQVIVMTRNSIFSDSAYHMRFQKEDAVTCLLLRNEDNRAEYTLLK